MNVYKKILKNIRLLILFTVFISIFGFGYKFFVVVGDSMNPSNDSLDIVLVNKLSYDFEPPKRGDVIVFYDFVDNDFLIKRVIGVPGDSIEIVNGWIYRNGELYVDSFSDVNVTNGISINPIFLGEKEYWVIGDNRGESWYGIIDEEQIVGQYYE
jgi:signal peptidase I